MKDLKETHFLNLNNDKSCIIKKDNKIELKISKKTFNPLDCEMNDKNSQRTLTGLP